MGHITHQYGPYYRPTPNPSLRRGAQTPPFSSSSPHGGTEGGSQYGPYYRPTPAPPQVRGP